MKTKFLIMFVLMPMLAFTQVKGKSSKDPFTTSKGTTFKKGQVVKLSKPSNGDKFSFAYISKSGFSLGKIAKMANSVRNVSNLNVSSISEISSAVNTVSEIANSELVSSAMNQLIGEAVSESYVKENALPSSMEGAKFKIKKFKVYTDKNTGDQVVHAIAKGNGKTVAILLDFAEKTGEI